MSFLYDEDSEQHHRELDAHVRTCSECAARMNAFRAGRHALDGWKLPQPRLAQPRPILRWAAAAAVLLAIGIGIGRYSRADATSLRASLQQELDARLAAAHAETQQLLAGWAQDFDRKHESDTANVRQALKQMDVRHGAEAARLRRDLDTVAIVADARLSQAQEQLYQLASFNPPAALSPRDDP